MGVDARFHLEVLAGRFVEFLPDLVDGLPARDLRMRVRVDRNKVFGHS